jgi:glycosyltransferase involved in cell wall biosynthesis
MLSDPIIVERVDEVSGSLPSSESALQTVSSASKEPLRGKRMAVVVFSHYPSDPRPRRAAEALAQAGMQVEVISLKQDDNEMSRESYNGVSILRVPLRRRRGGKVGYFWQYGAFVFAAFFLLAFRSLYRRYSLIHVHNMPDVLVLAALVPKVFGAKVILDLHDPMPELMTAIYGLGGESLGVRLLKRLEKWSIVCADVVLTPNAAFERLFAARSCRAQKLRVIMNSPDESIFKYRELAEPAPIARSAAKPFVIMYHGALVERHGLDLAVQAVHLLRSSIPGVELRIFGRATPFLRQVMDQVRDCGVQDYVRYLGGKTLEEIAEAVDECDVGIIPNRRSAFTEINLPTRIFEYLARGKPVVAPRTVGIQDYFGKEEVVYFELGSAEDLAQRIHYVFSHPREVHEIMKRGQAVYRAHCWRQERSRLLGLVCEVLNGVRSR